MAYPNIILITDSIPSANGGGISQTLYNLFSNYPADISIIVRPEENIPDISLKASIIYFPMERLRPWSNRAGKWINTYIQKFNHWRLDKMPIAISELQSQTNALIIVSTTDPIKLHLSYSIQKKLDCEIIPYFMDDWLYNNNINWPGNNIQNIAKAILEKANAWLLISENLHQTFLTRYQLTERPYLVIHNPAPSVSFKLADDEVDEGLIIYAGSIWPMHLDALQLTAAAVAKLQAAGKTQFRLLIYTMPFFWEAHKDVLNMPGVIYGGLISYEQLQSHLQKASLLLVAASFMPKYKGFTFSSVQTKLTDYMAAGRPILYVGPPDGASGLFVKQWDCGFCCNNQDASDLSKELMKIVSNKEEWLEKANKGKIAIAEHFNKETVQKKLYQFLQQHYYKK